MRQQEKKNHINNDKMRMNRILCAGMVSIKCTNVSHTGHVNVHIWWRTHWSDAEWKKIEFANEQKSKYRKADVFRLNWPSVYAVFFNEGASAVFECAIWTRVICFIHVYLSWALEGFDCCRRRYCCCCWCFCCRYCRWFIHLLAICQSLRFCSGHSPYLIYSFQRGNEEKNNVTTHKKTTWPKRERKKRATAAEQPHCKRLNKSKVART